MAYEDNLKEFIDKYRDRLEAKQNGEDDLQREFTELKAQALKVKQGKATTAGEKQSNFRKNRYKDILPFDETRFVLKSTETSPDGYDYINASYVKGVNRDHAYIAAQGPLPTTVNDFWRLLWESGGSVIIMACNEYELGKNKNRQFEPTLQQKHKCERYWAEEGETKQFDDIVVTLIDSDFKKRDYKERTLRATKGNEEKTFHQFHYTAWPDHGVPDTVSPILELRHKARKVQQHQDKPLIIHCSAGCGRTGTIMVLDYVAELMKKKEVPQDFSVFDVIMDMRKQRPAIVQTKDQYEFVHRAISELFKHELSTLGQDYGHNYVNVQIGVPPAVAAKKTQPRMPPGLPSTTSNTAKPRPTSGDKSLKPSPPQKPNDTVYANAADVASLANPPQPAPLAKVKRSSSRDVKDWTDGDPASAVNRQDPQSKVQNRPKIAVRKERLSDTTLHSSSINTPPPQKVVIPPAIKNITMQVSPAPQKHSPLHKHGQFETIRDNLNQTLSSTNVKANPPVRDRPNYTPPKPPQKGPNASMAVSKQDDSHRTRSKVQSANASEYELVTPFDSGRAQRPAKPRNVIPRRPSSDSVTNWKENSFYQSGDGSASSDNLPGKSEVNVSYQSAEPPGNPPPRPPPQSRHEYEPVSAIQKPPPPAKPSTSSSSEYDLVSFESNGPNSPSPVLGPKSGGILTPADSSHSHTAYNLQSRSNVRTAPHIIRATPPATKNSAIGSFAIIPSNQDPETDKSEEVDDDAPEVPQRTADSYELIDPTEAPHEKVIREEKIQQSGGIGTLRGVQRRLQNTKDQLTSLFISSSPSDDANNVPVPRPAPPQSQHSGPRPFPHRNAKPIGPRPKPPHMKHSQTGRAHVGAIPLN